LIQFTAHRDLHHQLNRERGMEMRLQIAMESEAKTCEP